MLDWRALFGFSSDESPTYELVHDRWRDQARRYERDDAKLHELGHALAQARRELGVKHGPDDAVHPEQLLPP